MFFCTISLSLVTAMMFYWGFRVLCVGFDVCKSEVALFLIFNFLFGVLLSPSSQPTLAPPKIFNSMLKYVFIKIETFSVFAVDFL